MSVVAGKVTKMYFYLYVRDSSTELSSLARVKHECSDTLCFKSVQKQG